MLLWKTARRRGTFNCVLLLRKFRRNARFQPHMKRSGMWVFLSTTSNPA
ncbi:hypothetical protein Barb4_00804 [Bacteroidales bacterium Barb4]|nr:hypothetical protein Barb4_00804 [Bacteroidales bacterium Barb4]